MKVKMIRASLLAAGIAMLGSIAPLASAQDSRSELRQDNREIRQDRQELRDDYRELQRDRADYARARASGDIQGMQRERREIRQDMAEINRDRAELRHDLRERRQDQQRANWNGEHRQRWNEQHHDGNADRRTAWQTHQPHDGMRPANWQGNSASTPGATPGAAANNGNNGLHRGWQIGRGNPHGG